MHPPGTCQRCKPECHGKHPVGVDGPEIVRRLLLAAAVGGMIGAERELHRKSAGFRTNILIGMGSAVFTMMSIAIVQERGIPAGSQPRS